MTDQIASKLTSAVQLLRAREDLDGNGDFGYAPVDPNLHRHVLYEYPARMISQMQGDLLNVAIENVPSLATVVDPFMGSGTILSEAMDRGLDFVGQDINPLSLLVCQVQSGPFHSLALGEHNRRLAGAIASDKSRAIEVDFEQLDKWFTEGAQVGLSRLRRHIVAVDARWARKFFWVCFAETVRLTSRSRLSTYKLHIRSKENLQRRRVDPEAVFSRVVKRNITKYTAIEDRLTKAKRLSRGHYKGEIVLNCRDILSGIKTGGLDKLDLLMTSPPYGDNKTTIPYGQNSFLPLKWMDAADISGTINPANYANPGRMDSASLGGSMLVLDEDVERLTSKSKTLRQLHTAFADLPEDRNKRLFSFCRDLGAAIEVIEGAMAEGSYGFWTLGGRSINNQRIPIDKIVIELSKQQKQILTLQRRIPRKRMASRNATTDTMSKETILVTKFG